MIMRTTTFAVLGLLLLAAVPSGAHDSCHVEVSAVPGGALLFADGFESGDVEAWQPDPAIPTFSARATDDLVFTVAFEPGAVDEQDLVQLRILLPSGDLFQEMKIPVATAAARSGDAGDPVHRRVPGYPYPVPERILSLVDGSRGPEERVTVQFPVGGTQIVRNSLHGEWTVQTFLGDDGQPCGPAAVFLVTE